MTQAMSDSGAPDGNSQDQGGELAALLRGDPDVTEGFVRRHAGWMMAVARKIVRDRSAAEDTVQNAFAAIFSKLNSFEGKSKLRTWMHRIVVNEALMLLRKRQQTREDSIEPMLAKFYDDGCRIEGDWATYQTPEQIIQKTQSARQIATHIDQLPDKYRVVLVLRDIEEFSTAEVAEMLDLSEANVKVRLHRARAALKSLLEPLMRGKEL